MDRIQQMMLHYRDTEAITFFLCLGPSHVGLGAKADVAGTVYKCTSSWALAPHAEGDRTVEILEEMLEMVTEIRRERRLNAPSEPHVQLG